MENVKRYTVTAALPYANGPVHLGHLAGCYLPSDIYARYLRLQERDVLFLCGSDEHGVGIAIKAAQEGMTPRELVDKYHPIIKQSFVDFGISFDYYARTSSPVHYKTAQDFFKNLYEKNIFHKKTTTQFYDVVAGQFLADRYITGTCPNCCYEKAYGDQCERCGKSLDPMDLIEPKSALSGEKPELRETEHWFLPLQDFEPWLRDWILGMHKEDWKKNVLGQCGSWINQGLQERAVTRDLEWGVPVPLDEAKGKVLYVWFDAPIGYISAAEEWGVATGKDWEPYWKDKETKLVHFIGKDNIVFHCIVFPSMLKAHGEFILPDNVPANEFLNLEGEKLSTSRNWAVWLHEYLNDFPGKQDVLRYVLCRNAPEGKDNDFTWKDFQTCNDKELADIYGNLVNRLMVMTHKNFDGKLPALIEMGPLEEGLLAEVQSFPGKIAALVEEYKFREALQEVMNLARAGNKYLTDNEPWKLVKTDLQKAGTVVHCGMQLLASLAIVAEPFLPFSSGSLRGFLNIRDKKWADAGRFDLLTEGQDIEKAPILFDKIPDAAIEAQIARLHAGQEKALTLDDAEIPVQEINYAPMKPDISFDDFSKLDLRIGTVKHAEAVPKSKKLLKLSVDLGFEERTIASGIAEHYKPEDMIGKQVMIVANLAPRTIMNIQSQGMILMIEDADGKLVMLSPQREVSAGMTVS